MIRLADVLVLVPQFTPIEARMAVLASWSSDNSATVSSLRLAGQVIGPLCEYATTLSNRIPLQPIGAESGSRLRASAQILEPCFWEPQHPFCYEIHLELHGEEGLLDMRRLIAGLRHLETHGLELLLNGQTCFMQGVKHWLPSSITELEAWHDADCGVFLGDASTGLCERTDRWGPMVLHILPPVEAEGRMQVARLRNHASLLMWVLPAAITGEPFEEFVDLIRGLDRSRPIGRMLGIEEATIASSAADVLFLPSGHPEIGTTEPIKPYIVVGPAPTASEGCSPESFPEQLAEFLESLGSRPGLVGVML